MEAVAGPFALTETSHCSYHIQDSIGPHAFASSAYSKFWANQEPAYLETVPTAAPRLLAGPTS